MSNLFEIVKENLDCSSEQAFYESLEASLKTYEVEEFVNINRKPKANQHPGANLPFLFKMSQKKKAVNEIESQEDVLENGKQKK